MKNYLREIIASVLFAMFLPQLFIAVAVWQRGEKKTIQGITDTQPAQAELLVNVRIQDKVVSMTMDAYVTGVILQELPDSFSEEAKKAQAIVARTYALRQCSTDKHNGAVCTDSMCCQAYIDPELYLTEGGDPEAVDRARAAADSTHDTVLLFQGELIEATFFSCSGGRTEDAVAVWGTQIPYLQSVESPGEEYATHYVDTVVFTQKEFAQALGVETDFAIGDLQRTTGGGVDWVEIGGEVFTGLELRQKLQLRSTCFYITKVGDSITLTTRGYGHRVGMSQYGADAMAREGASFAEILSHYYPGTNLETYTVSHGEELTNA